MGAFGWNYSKRYFDRLLWLSESGWAWEFKRRDPNLKGLARRSQARPFLVNRYDGTSLVRLRRRCRDAEAFGLHYLPDPSLSAFETPLFWLPELMTSNIDAVAELTARLSHMNGTMSCAEIPGKKTYLLVAGRRPKLVITARSFSVQLAINSANEPIPLAIYLALRLANQNNLYENSKCIDRFVRYCCGKKITAAPQRGYSPDRLRQTLIALDGYLSGASQREIAQVIFGAKSIKEDWNSGVLSYKSRVRRLIDKGRRLMEADYVNLL